MSIPTLGTFLTFEELEEYKTDFQKVLLVQTETYNEYDLKKVIDRIGKDILAAIAIQLAVVGYGNKTYGEVIVDDKKVNIYDFFKKNGIKSDLTINSKLTTKDLTPRRIIRFFRYTIDDYIKNNNDIQSYLFKKYCLNKNGETRAFTYPGFEHIAEPTKDTIRVKELLKTYEFLDSRLNTKISERIKRVLIARGFNESVFDGSTVLDIL